MYHWKPAPIEPLKRSERSRPKPALRRWTSFNVNPVLLCCSLISAYRANRAQSSHPSLKLLITTAYAGQARVHEGRLDPGIELLKKPFSFAALAVRIRELLDGGVGKKGAVHVS
jgi:hypothetical protein